MYISASAPDAPPFSETTMGCFIRLFFWIAACIIRAIWSEAPPAPAATTISTGLVGSQPANAGALATMAVATAAAFMISRTRFFLEALDELLISVLRPASYLAELQPPVQAASDAGLYDFRMRRQALIASRRNTLRSSVPTD